ncbi:MAG: type II/IV secretion system protein, partial [Candidatus Wildermuthbacteria bacterium]|nr:type II/IV secretion system protein [Candidatus Wildermuthbacteria bacterium]
METIQREKLTGQVKISQQELQSSTASMQGVKDVRSALESLDQKDVSAFLSSLLLGAYLLEASDLHAETEKGHVKVRLRIDGLLQDLQTLTPSWYSSLLSRIKLVSGVKLNVSDRPQDGRFSLVFEGRDPIEVRVSSLPSEYGESLVLRLLDPTRLVKIKGLGLREDLEELFLREIKKPNGMIVVTGPTGSGKTTTLYAFLQEVQDPELKIITIEDPIEYHLEGINQTQVNPQKGYDFASGLRAIVRQDPDVILVGEVRDSQTAEIALQAALTGHLVFSTIHTNDAAGTISRFSALGSKQDTISSALSLIIAQRLVRKVCQACASLRKATPEETKKIRQAVGSLKIAKPSSFKIAEPKGCKTCNGTGYKGRVGIFEAIVV